MSADLARAFDDTAARLARALGAPTDTEHVNGWCARRHAWTTGEAFASVRLDSRGVVLYAHGPGTPFGGRLYTPDMVVAPSPDLVARWGRREVPHPAVVTVEEMHCYTRERWRGALVQTTPEVAVEAVWALVQGDLARESTEDDDGR